MTGRLAAGLVAALVVLLLGAWPTAAQEEIDLGEVARRAAQALAQARAAYDEADYSQAILLLNRLLDDQEIMAPGALAVEEADVVAEALKLRGVSFYNVGQVEAAEKDFARLLRLDPDYELDSQLLSPKIVSTFKDVRNRTTGLLTVLSEPPGADVRLGERTLGATPVEDVRIPGGSYRLRVGRAGFAVSEESVEIVPGERLSHDVTLLRNARSVIVLTVPTEARVFVDDEEIGTTTGSPPPGFETVLLSRGLNPLDASAPLVVPHLSGGDHVIRIEKECHTTFEATFNVEIQGGELPLELEPIVLEESVGSVYVDSTPAGAAVSIDGRSRGRTPLQIDDLCAGSHRVKVHKAGLGRWWGEVDLQPEDRRTVRVSLRPTLASLGAVRQFGVDNPDADRWDRFLAELVDAQTAYNPVPLDLSENEETAFRWDLYHRLQMPSDTGVRLDEPSRRAVRDQLEADLFLVARPIDRDTAEVLLYGTQQGTPDRLLLDRSDSAQVRALARRLSVDTRLTVGWSGLQTVEIAETDFPYVLQLSPLAPSGTTASVGDLVRAVEGRPVVSRRELEDAFAERTPGLPVQVTVERDGRTTEATVVTAETPVLPRLGESDLLFNKYLADLLILRAQADDGDERALASLGIGLAYLMAGQPERAQSEGFSHVELSRPAGISQGTVDYLQGIAYEAQGIEQADKAVEAFRRAAAAAAATLDRDDGLLVAPFAAARLRDDD